MGAVASAAASLLPRALPAIAGFASRIPVLGTLATGVSRVLGPVGSIVGKILGNPIGSAIASAGIGTGVSFGVNKILNKISGDESPEASSSFGGDIQDRILGTYPRDLRDTAVSLDRIVSPELRSKIIQEREQSTLQRMNQIGR